MPKKTATDQAKEMAAKLAKEYIKKAAMQATASVATTVAPWVGIGCAVIAGIFLAILLFSVLVFVSLYGFCQYAPNATLTSDMSDLCAIIIKPTNKNETKTIQPQL